MQPKREPLLADRVLATAPIRDSLVPLKVMQRVVGLLHEAKRFVLSEDASRYVGEFIDKVPHAIAHAQEFAIPAFTNTYIEFPIRPLWVAINHLPPDETADTRVGYLFAGPDLYVLSEAPKEVVGKGGVAHKMFESGLCPVVYRLNRPFKLGEELKFAEDTKLSRLQLDNFFWGSSIEKLPPAYTRAFRAHHSCALLLRDNLPTPLVDLVIERQLMGSAGDLRNAIALVLFLNQTSKLRYETDVPHHRGMIGNKASTFLKHSVITIRLNPLPGLKKLLGGQGAWRREHDVRGHFCRNKQARNAPQCNIQEHSQHDWTEVSVNQWRCLKCGGLMWHKKDYHRGHKEKGISQTEYKVVT